METYPDHPLGLLSPFWSIMVTSPRLGKLVGHFGMLTGDDE